MSIRTRFISCNNSLKESRGVLLGAHLTENHDSKESASDIIRKISSQIEDYHILTGRSLSDLKLYDGGNVFCDKENQTEKLNAIYEKALSIIEEKKFLLTIAEEREVSYSLIKAAYHQYQDLRVVVIDARHGLENKCQDEINSKNFLSHAIHDFLPKENIIELGTRCGSKESYENGARRHRHLPPRVKRGVIERLPKLYHHPVYLSINLDVLEPSVAPGVKTPSSWGVSSVELMESIRYFESISVVAMDFVGFDLSKDVADITSILAASLIKESFIYLVENGEKTLDKRGGL